jgi:Uma2 family endonuclease
MSRSATTRPVVLANGRTLPTAPMSYQAFLEWLTDDTHAEWVDGWVVPMSPINSLHDQLVAFLRALMQHFLDAYPIGQLRGEPFQMKTAPDLPGRSPDILFVANEHLDRLHDALLQGPADLTVEVISPDSGHRDRVEKYGEYEQGGVREYWLPDPQTRQAAFFLLGEDGRYHPISIGEDGIFRSAVLNGFWLKVDWLWQEPLPKLTSVLRDWGLI